MNPDDLDDARLGEVVARTLEAMAGQPSPARLQAAMPRVRRAVGRRRAAKITGVTTCSLALVAGIGFGAWAAPWEHTSPAPATSPTPTPTPSPSLTPTPSPEPETDTTDPNATTALDDPRFSPSNTLFDVPSINSSDELPQLMCGDPVSELLALPRGDLTLTTSSIEPLGDGKRGVSGRVRITNTGPDTFGTDYGSLPPTVVYVQAGRVVGAGAFAPNGYETFDDLHGESAPPLAPGQSFDTDVVAGTAGWTGGSRSGWTCGSTTTAEGGFTVFVDAQPGGVYDVYPIAGVVTDETTFMVGDKVTVTVPDATETPTPNKAASSALTDPRFSRGAKFPYRGGTCGMPLDEFAKGASDDRFRLEIVGDVTVSTTDLAPAATAPARITDVSGQGLTTTPDKYGTPVGYSAGDPLLVWTQDGEVVDFHNWVEGGTYWTAPEGWNPDGTPIKFASAWVHTIEPGGSFDTYATSRGGWHCGTQGPVDEGGVSREFPDSLPAGEYEVYAYAWFAPDGADWTFLLSDPVSVTVPD